jgi:hypothetical protein
MQSGETYSVRIASHVLLIIPDSQTQSAVSHKGKLILSCFSASRFGLLTEINRTSNLCQIQIVMLHKPIV